MWIRSGWKRLEHLVHEGNVAQKCGIVAEIFFKGEGEEAAGQLQRPDVAFFEEGLGAVSGADAEKGQVAAAREGFKVAAGVGYAVHFVEGVGEVGHARARIRSCGCSSGYQRVPSDEASVEFERIQHATQSHGCGTQLCSLIRHAPTPDVTRLRESGFSI